MTPLHLHLMVMDDWWPSASTQTLYTKYLHAAFVPLPGEQVESWHDGPMFYVRQRYLQADGTAGVDLKRLVVDSKHELPAVYDDTFWRDHATWWTNSEGGPPEPLLLAHGWRLWTPDPRRDDS